MINRAIQFPMSEERLLELYGKHFPGEPYDTDAALRVLQFGGDVAYHCWQNGAQAMQELYEQRQHTVKQTTSS